MIPPIQPYKHSLILGLLLIALLSACANINTELSPVPTSQSYILSDDFSRPSSKWARFDTEESAAYVENEEFFLEDRGKGIAAYSPLLNQKYEDVSITVSARHVQGSMNNWMGVICRQQDEANYYLLAISADGYYLIQLVADDIVLPLAGPDFSEAIHIGKVTNELEATCQGEQLSLFVNGKLLASKENDTLDEPGRVAIFADAVEGGGSTTTAFDDFVLSNP